MNWYILEIYIIDTGGEGEDVLLNILTLTEGKLLNDVIVIIGGSCCNGRNETTAKEKYAIEESSCISKPLPNKFV